LRIVEIAEAQATGPQTAAVWVGLISEKLAEILQPHDALPKTFLPGQSKPPFMGKRLGTPGKTPDPKQGDQIDKLSREKGAKRVFTAVLEAQSQSLGVDGSPMHRCRSWMHIEPCVVLRAPIFCSF
jgi:hypothetical protein